VPEIARTLQAALDDWVAKAPLLAKAAQAIEAGGGEAFDPV
jgi:fumarylacetoacetate (FAA) hydrolase